MKCRELISSISKNLLYYTTCWLLYYHVKMYQVNIDPKTVNTLHTNLAILELMKIKSIISFYLLRRKKNEVHIVHIVHRVLHLPDYIK